MSNVPAELKYSKEHEWLRKEADGTYTCLLYTSPSPRDA